MVLLIGRGIVSDLLVLDELVVAVEQAHEALASGTAQQPPRCAVPVPGSTTVMVPMAAALGPHRVAGLKLLTDAPDNPAAGRPRQQSLIVVLDPATGSPEAVVDGAVVTRLRTAAASAVATRHLAAPEACVLGLVGAGGLAAAHVAAISLVRPIRQVVVWTRSTATVRRFEERMAAANKPVEVLVVAHPRDVVEAADILCTLTPSREPIVRGEWLHDGMHVNAVGAPPRPDHREIDTEVVRRSRVVVDDRSVALTESGAVLAALAAGACRAEHVQTELGEVIAGHAPGRQSPSEITLFNSVGVPVQDLAAARLVVDAARITGRGTEVDLTV